MPSDWTAVENRFHIRNVDPRWCVIEVDPAASVRLTTYPYGDIDEPRVATLERFGELFASSRLIAVPVLDHDGGGIITAIEEQFIP